MIFRQVAWMCFVAFLVGHGLSAKAEHSNSPNILLICIDDLRPELGCYGGPADISPHIDQFAKTAARFTNHFVAVPTCGASRYALLTGHSPYRSGFTAGNEAFSQLQNKGQIIPPTMPSILKERGYHTIAIGKISHSPDGRLFAYDGSGDGRHEIPDAWDELATPIGDWSQNPWGNFFAYANGHHREDGQGHADLMQFTVEADDDLPDGQMANAAVQKLHELADSTQPFFLAVGFYKPHLPFVATRKDWQAVQDWAVNLPIGDKMSSVHFHRSGEFFRYEFPFPKVRPLPNDSCRQAILAYWACVRYVDRQVGKVLASLQQSGLDASTSVILWSDHGWFLGEGQLWGKHAPLELALRSPLLIRPAGQNEGKRMDQVVESIDLLPTVLEMTNVAATGSHVTTDGRSLLPLISGETVDSDAGLAISYWKNAISIRTERYRLVTTVDSVKQDGGSLQTASELELYDLQATDGLLKNIADQHPAMVKRLQNKIIDRHRQLGSPRTQESR
ncbi:MAG: sulfatase [Pirellulaceae bacterium]